MNFRICDFNIGDVVVEYDLDHGELVDLKVYRTSQRTCEYIEISKFLDESALEEIVREIIERSHENGNYDKSFEKEYDNEVDIA